MRVLITGGAGFIGSHVCQRLAGAHDVVCIDDLSCGDRVNLEGVAATLVEGSILDQRALAAAMEGADVVVHLAALPSVPRSIANPSASHDANATGTLKVLEATRQLDDPLVIVASSSSVYGGNPTIPKHEGLAPLPLSPYAVSKLAAEQYALAWRHSYGVRTLAFRFFNVFGPRQSPGHAYAAAIPSFGAAALRRQPLTIYGDGNQTRDFTSVETVAEVIADAISRQVSHACPVNLAFGTRTSLLDVVAILENIVDHEIERRHVDARPGDVVHSQADDTILRSLFPDVMPISLQMGLKQTLDWLERYLSIESSHVR